MHFNSLTQFYTFSPEVLASLGTSFTLTEEDYGIKKEIELKEGGAGIEVTEQNLPEFIEACLKYHLLGRYESQLNELVLGFFEVIPEPLLTIFDVNELELLMCGLPEIDINDWKRNTIYDGMFIDEGPNHQVCVWFWEIVTQYDDETKARLLQFVTGEWTSAQFIISLNEIRIIS